MDPSTAIQGLAVLTAIPVVMFALWSQYFWQHYEELKKKNTVIDPAIELRRIRFAGASLIFFQLTIFLASGALRKANPGLGFALFAISLAVQGVLQANLERKVRPVEARPKEQLDLAARSFLWALIVAGIYVGVSIGSIVVFAGIAKLFHASNSVTAVLSAIGAIIGVFGGLGVGFALGPIHVRRVLPTRPLEEGEKRQLLQSVFGDAGLKVPEIFVIDADRFQFSNAFVSGFNSGKGWFKPGLFVSNSLIHHLTTGELRAVVTHEASHLALEHLKKRVTYSCGLVLCSAFLGIMLIMICHALFPNTGAGGWISSLTAIASFAICMNLLNRQNRFFEMEADLHAIEKLSCGFEDWSNALRKIDHLNDQDPSGRNPFSVLAATGHPSTERRIALVEAILNKKKEIQSEDLAA